MLKTDTVLVLARSRQGEADGIARVLAESGQSFEVRVHGIFASRNRSSLIIEPAAKVRLVYYERDKISSAKEGQLLERYEDIKANYRLWQLAAYYLELTALAARQGPAPELYVLLDGVLQTLRGSEWERGSINTFYQIRILHLLGILGATDVCNQCGCELRAYDTALWNFPEMHFNCPDCADATHQRDALAAALIHKAATRRYGRFHAGFMAATAEDDRKYLDERLHDVLTYFNGRPFISARGLYAEKSSLH